MIKFVCNAFSLQMINGLSSYNVKVNEIFHWKEIMRDNPNAISAIGHADTAAVLGLPCNRVNVSLTKGDSIIVCQLIGGRLPEGSTTLPEGFTFKFFLVTIE